MVNENQGARAEDVTPSVATCPPQKDASTNHIGDVSAMCSDKSTDKSNAASVDAGAANYMPTIDNMGSLLLAQPDAPHSKVQWEDLENEAFDDWLTQFEMIAGLFKWEGLARLVHLATCLRDQHSHSTNLALWHKGPDYQLLVGEVRKRFTPVHIQAVQTSRFHERKQKTGETVDDYAQDLQKLFRKAYPTTSRGSHETEQMGQTVLSSQFVAGLLPDIKSKVAGVEGELEKLPTKARFEKQNLEH